MLKVCYYYYNYHSSSCEVTINLQRPVASQLLDHPFVKKVKRGVSLKDHKHLFDCSRKNRQKHKHKDKKIISTVKRYIC